MARSSSGEPTLRRARSPSPRALPGYVIDGGASWSHSFALPQFTAGAVTFIDHSGTARDTYTVSSVKGWSIWWEARSRRPAPMWAPAP